MSEPKKQNEIKGLRFKDVEFKPAIRTTDETKLQADPSKMNENDQKDWAKFVELGVDKFVHVHEQNGQQVLSARVKLTHIYKDESKGTRQMTMQAKNFGKRRSLTDLLLKFGPHQDQNKEGFLSATITDGAMNPNTNRPYQNYNINFVNTLEEMQKFIESDSKKAESQKEAKSSHSTKTLDDEIPF